MKMYFPVSAALAMLLAVVSAAPIPRALIARVDQLNPPQGPLNPDDLGVDCHKMTHDSDGDGFLHVPLPPNVSSVSKFDAGRIASTWAQSCIHFQGAKSRRDIPDAVTNTTASATTTALKPRDSASSIFLDCHRAEGPADDGTFTVPPANDPNFEGLVEALFSTNCIKVPGVADS